MGLSAFERWVVLVAALLAIFGAAWRANRALISRLDSIDDNTKAWQEMRAENLEMRAENLQQKAATEENTRAIERLTQRLDRGGL